MERSNGAFADPMKLWGQLYENTSKVWTDAVKTAQDRGYADPYGLYRQWFSAVSSAGTLGQGGSGNAVAAVSPGSMPGMGGMPQMDQKSIQENTQRWLAMTAETYRKAAKANADFLKLGPRWLAMLEEVRENIFNGDALPTDPLSFGVRWYNATSEPLSRFVGELLETDEFLENSSRLFENYATLYKVFSKNSEEYLHTVQLPTRSDMSRVAGLVVALEDKVDGVEEAMEDMTDSFGSGLASEEGLGAVEGRVGQVEDRLDRVEGKLDRLLAAVEALGNAPAANGKQSADEAAPKEASKPATRRKNSK